MVITNALIVFEELGKDTAPLDEANCFVTNLSVFVTFILDGGIPCSPKYLIVYSTTFIAFFS